jgi:N-acetylglutamate synthase-like GNAT family acetyltransferase
MIRPCTEGDFEGIHTIINEAAEAYRSVIPQDRWKEPYMSRAELRHEIEDGVVFWGIEKEGELVGVMGIQDKRDVALIRHSYVRTHMQNKGIGSQLLSYLQQKSDQPILIGTWADALWAIRFYEKHGYRKVGSEEKDRLLKTYWSIPERQIETSVVLGNKEWFEVG